MFALPRLAACSWIVLIAGCGSKDLLDRAGVALTPGSGWKPAAATTWPVPGTPLAAWSGPGGASLVVYRSLPVPDGRASDIAGAIVTRLASNPGLRVVAQTEEKLSGLDAARVDIVAPGTGDALAPSGRGVPLAPGSMPLKPTRRIVVTIVRPADTLALVWHAPEASVEVLETQVRATLQSLKIDRGRLATASY
jgi:hypothetical protein